VLVDPKNAAGGPDGRIYVVEGRAARVSIFNQDGTLAGSFGTPGAGDGQFNEPWGIAVAPNGDVYVADTWNHRVQRFDSNGTFLGKWGRLGDAKGSTTTDPGVFWGPRSVAISPQGEVYVSDTGNKRIQVFTPDGTFVRMFGGDGSDPGQFHEDVGITFDSQGNLWVADAWNRRVQELDPSGKPLAQFPVSSGWESQSITNKPYIAVNGQGQIVVTMPDQGKTAIFSREGQLISQTQLPGAGTPVGVAAGPGGKLLFADARNNVVVQMP
jgi:DNA-binding beta-propeller fold protein YncE